MTTRRFAAMRYVKREPHRVASVVTAATAGAPVDYIGVHGYCGECGGPVIMNRFAKYRHVEEKPLYSKGARA